MKKDIPNSFIISMYMMINFAYLISGMLSNSYVTEVYYKTNSEDDELSVESWFVKVSIYS